MEKGPKAGFLRLRSSKITLTKEKKERRGRKEKKRKKIVLVDLSFSFAEIVFGRKKKRPFEGGDLSIRLDLKFSSVTIQKKRFWL